MVSTALTVRPLLLLKLVALRLSDMTLGLGTGSTAAHALDRLGALLRVCSLRGVAEVPTTLKMEAHAARVGIPMLALADAAEIDPDLNLVKGRGGSLLREKMIESVAARSSASGARAPSPSRSSP